MLCGFCWCMCTIFIGSEMLFLMSIISVYDQGKDFWLETNIRIRAACFAITQSFAILFMLHFPIVSTTFNFLRRRQRWINDSAIGTAIGTSYIFIVLNTILGASVYWNSIDFHDEMPALFATLFDITLNVSYIFVGTLISTIAYLLYSIITRQHLVRYNRMSEGFNFRGDSNIQVP